MSSVILSNNLELKYCSNFISKMERKNFAFSHHENGDFVIWDWKSDLSDCGPSLQMNFGKHVSGEIIDFVFSHEKQIMFILLKMQNELSQKFNFLTKCFTLKVEELKLISENQFIDYTISPNKEIILSKHTNNIGIFWHKNYRQNIIHLDQNDTVSFSPNSLFIAIGKLNKITIYNNDGYEYVSFNTTSTIYQFVWSPTSKSLAVLKDNTNIEIINIETKKNTFHIRPTHLIPNKENYILGKFVDFMFKNDSILIIMNNNQTIYVWNIIGKFISKTLSIKDNTLYSCDLMNSESKPEKGIKHISLTSNGVLMSCEENERILLL